MNIVRFGKKVKYNGSHYHAGSDIEVSNADLKEMIGLGCLVVSLSNHVEEEHEEKPEEAVPEEEVLEDDSASPKPPKSSRRSNKA